MPLAIRLIVDGGPLKAVDPEVDLWACLPSLTYLEIRCKPWEESEATITCLSTPRQLDDGSVEWPCARLKHLWFHAGGAYDDKINEHLQNRQSAPLGHSRGQWQEPDLPEERRLSRFIVIGSDGTLFNWDKGKFDLYAFGTSMR